MADKKTSKRKQVDYAERLEIQKFSEEGCGVNEIARRLQRSSSTISQELKLGRIKLKNAAGRVYEAYSADEAMLQHEYNQALKKSWNQVSEEIRIEIQKRRSLGETGKEIYFEIKQQQGKEKISQATIYRIIQTIDANQKLGDSYYKKGKTIWLNLAVGESCQEALKYFERGARLNHAQCFYYLGNFYQSGSPGIEKDTALAFRYIDKACQLGYSKAQDKLGYFYECGIGCKVNKDLAKDMYLLAALNGSVTGMVSYADNVEHGISGYISLPTARRWYKAAADCGNFMAKIWLENHDEEYFESLGEHVSYSLEEYDYQHAINLGRHMTIEEVHIALENRTISELFESDEAIEEKLALIAKYGYTLPPFNEMIDPERYKDCQDPIKPISKQELFSKMEQTNLPTEE